VVIAVTSFLVARHFGASIQSLDDLVDIRTEASPDESRLRVTGRVGSSVLFIQGVSARQRGSTILLTVTGNLPYLAGLSDSGAVDYTFAVPRDVTEVRLAPKGDVLWRRGDCLRRWRRSRDWHCDEPHT
jgi:hypothetical protein